MVVRLVGLAIGLVVTSTQAKPPTPADCGRFYSHLDGFAARWAPEPSYPRPVEDFPHLRVDRFLASFRHDALDEPGLRNWLDHLAAADRQVRFIHWRQLPTAGRDFLSRHYGIDDPGALYQVLEHCAARHNETLAGDPQRLAELRRRATVPHDYSHLRRVLGLYPLTAKAAQAGVDQLHAEILATFQTPPEDLPQTGELHHYGPRDAPSTMATPVSPLPRDGLGIPQISGDQYRALVTRHAPLLTIDTAGDFDRPGVPGRNARGIPGVTPPPTVYHYSSFGRWQGRVLLQLVYVVWFDRRPKTGPLDLLGGALDGLVWRVTLDVDGVPLLYDTIHPCGCYWMFFPSPRLTLQAQAQGWPEPPLVPQPAPHLKPQRRIALRLASGSHYLQRVSTASVDREKQELRGAGYTWYDLVPYHTLYGQGLFGPNGIIDGSQRLESLVLWPMGIVAPGAMRERGRQPTVFVGYGHFDAAEALNQRFQPTMPPTDPHGP
ncbi:MAG: hypothetical protein ACFCBW_19055 [Candidatus Competibacterales bacterium]